MNKIVKEFTPIFSTEKNGKKRMWRAIIYTEKTIPHVLIEYGQVDGKMQQSIKSYTEGKNIGKKNETTPLEQCINETEKKWKDKIEKEGYFFENEDEDDKDEENEEKEEIYLPMLAQTYSPLKQKKKDISFPCYVQPKLDGLRCIAYMKDYDVVYQSRTGGHFETMGHLTKHLLRLLSRKFKNVILDGELYTTDIPFEELAGLIKKKNIKESDKNKLKHIQYHIYDIYEDGDTPFLHRYKKLEEMFKEDKENKEDNPLKLVETVIVNNPIEFKEKFSEFVERGYEGIMLRNIYGLYTPGYRSNDLQKYKEFFEDEYPIVDFLEGEGRDKGAVIWVCETNDKTRFKVRPKGSMELRREWFKNGKKYIGKNLTVIYQELSEYGVPRFPVGKSVREGF